jgi:hypothetical protein
MKQKLEEPTIDEVVQIGEDLDHEFRRQAGLYSWLSGKYVHACDRLRRLKMSLDLETAQLSDVIRKKLMTTNEKITLDRIEQWVIQQASYKKIKEEILEAQLIEETLGEGLRALEHKKSALENLAANLRRDWESSTREPSVRGIGTR